MPIYEYRCDQHGVSEITRPLGKAPKSVTCLVCGSESSRVFSVGMVRSGSRTALLAAMDHAEKSRHAPDVVTSVPSTGARRQMPVLPLTPGLRRLPRP
jgi:putative FmdB family regulatory protein